MHCDSRCVNTVHTKTGLRLLLGTEVLVMTPNSLDLSFLRQEEQTWPRW